MDINYTFHKILILFLSLFLITISGCDSADSQETKKLTINTPSFLKWQAPSQRVNGTAIEDTEQLSYEIWAGYDIDTLFWIYSYTPTTDNSVDIELNLSEVIAQNETPKELSELSEQTLYFGIIAIDENNNRSVMSELKPIKLNI